MRKILRAIAKALRAGAMYMAMLPVMGLDGIWRFIRALGPQPAAPEVSEYVDDTPDDDGEDAVADDGSRPIYRQGRYLGRLPKLPSTLGERIVEAARYKSDDLGWEFLLADISAFDELAWLGKRTPDELTRIAATAPAEIEAHLTGERPLDLPAVVRPIREPFVLPEPSPDPAYLTPRIVTHLRETSSGGRQLAEEKRRQEAAEYFDDLIAGVQPTW